MKLQSRIVVGLCTLLLVVARPGLGQEKNGFDLSNALIPVDEILSGGPPRDGIPSIDNPKFERAAGSLPWRENDLVMTYDHGQARYAFPVGILNWHEIVNHESEGEPVLITFCPLCGTGMAFDPVVNGRHLTFGVSGLLYNSDLLMYDHQTESLWSQIEGRAISGPLAGTELESVAVRHELWQSLRIMMARWKTGSGGRPFVFTTIRAYPPLNYVTKRVNSCPQPGLSGLPGIPSIRKPAYLKLISATSGRCLTLSLQELPRHAHRRGERIPRPQCPRYGLS